MTGGNAGIGFALCKQLTYDHGCHVYMGSRSLEKGTAAVKSIMDGLPASCKGKCEVVQLDTSSDESVISAAAVVKPILDAEGVQLYAIVNNAGAGLGHGVAPDVVMNTNLFGPKRVVEAFMPLLSKSGAYRECWFGCWPDVCPRMLGLREKNALQPRDLLGTDRRTCHDWTRLCG